jgi:hypothetical protein
VNALNKNLYTPRILELYMLVRLPVWIENLALVHIRVLAALKEVTLVCLA